MEKTEKDQFLARIQNSLDKGAMLEVYKDLLHKQSENPNDPDIAELIRTVITCINFMVSDEW